MMEQPAWVALEGRTTVPVEYLPTDPAWNRLVAGERKGSSLGGGFLFLSGGLTFLMLVLVVIAFFGIDLKSEKGVTQLTYRGRVVWQNRPAGPPMPFPPQAIPPPPPAMTPYFSTPAAPRKPAGLIALGVIAIILGLGGVLLAAGRLLVMTMQSVVLGDGRQIEFETTPWLKAWTAADGALALALVVVGVGLIALRRWARSLGIVVAAAQILSGIAGLIMLIVSAKDVIGDTAGPDAQPLVAGSIGAIIFQLLGLVFPAVLLAVLAKRSTADALTSASLPASHS
jgi:hypothetical protein